MGQTAEEKTNPVLTDLVKQLEEAGRVNDAAVWTRCADELRRSTRDQAEVTLSHIDRHAADGDVVVVPGKVVGSTRLDTDVTVAAFQFTRTARDRIEDAGEAVYLEDYVANNPDGSGVTLMT